MIYKLTVVSSLVILVAACHQQTFDKADIVGEYVANHGQGRDILKVFENGSYSHYFETVDGSPLEEKGRWTLDYVGNTDVVAFEGYTHLWREFAPPGHGIWPATVKIREGKVRLVLNSDLGYYYQQQ